MAIVLGILILLALCGSRAAQNGLTLLIGVPLALLVALMLVGMLAAGVTALTSSPSATRSAPVALRSATDLVEAQHARTSIAALRQRHSTQALP